MRIGVGAVAGGDDSYDLEVAVLPKVFLLSAAVDSRVKGKYFSCSY
jgi:hypothetical protein